MTRTRWVVFAAGLGLGLSLMPVSPAAAAPIDRDPEDWIVGEVIEGWACWTKAARTARLLLQAKDVRGRWVDLDVGDPVMTDGKGVCRAKYPVKVTYRFRLDVMPSERIPDSRGFLLHVREHAPPRGPSYSFVQKVYASRADQQRDIEEATCVALGGTDCKQDP